MTNGKTAFVSLIGAIGLIVLLIGLTNAYEFVTGLLWAITLWVLTAFFAQLLGTKGEPSVKKAVVSLIGGIGLLVLLIGIFTNKYDIWTGIIAAIVIWILNGVLAKFWGVKKHQENFEAKFQETMVESAVPVIKNPVKSASPSKPAKTATKKTVKKKTTAKKSVTKVTAKKPVKKVVKKTAKKTIKRKR